MKILIYGATGFTGKLICRDLAQTTRDFVIAGRSKERLEKLASELNVEFRVCDLYATKEFTALLSDIFAIIHVAGPFRETAKPVLEACLASSTHYVDVSAEAISIEMVAHRSTEAKEKGIMLLPGIGVDVVPSDCLASQVVSRLPSAVRLSFGVSLPKNLSSGSARNFVAQANEKVLVRRSGELREIEPGLVERYFNYSAGPGLSSAVSWGDVSSAYYSTGIGDITCYLESTPILRLAMAHASLMGPLLDNPFAKFATSTIADIFFAGPTEEQQQQERGCIVVEAEDAHGKVAASRITFPESYSFTAKICAEVARIVSRGFHQYGYQTPSRLFGDHFINQFDDVVIEEMV